MPSKSSSISFLSNFENIEDPRIDRHKLHSLSDILLIIFSGSICGAESWQDFADFAEAKLDYLRRFTALENGAPSKNTLHRVISRINPEQFKTCFHQWIRGIQRELGDVIAIDGKVLRGSFDKATEQSAIHMVSAFSTGTKLVLAQQKVDEKSNEITAIPKLLDMLMLKGAVVTMDAMGCQKSITRNIINAGGDYAIAVKGNQKKLHEQLKTHFNNVFDMQYHKQVDVSMSKEKNRNRIEQRLCLATSNIDWLEEKEKWAGLKSVIVVESKRTLNGKTSVEKRYYISSLEANAERLNSIARAHWGIGNSLHWILDATFNEDASRNRLNDTPENMALIKHVVLNQLQVAKRDFKKGMSIKGLRKNAGWKYVVLDKVLMARL
jgi:predicted transposase YbfD/YdcC